MHSVHVCQNEVAEIAFREECQQYHGGSVDVQFADPGGNHKLVPAFYSRGAWRCRYSSSIKGRHRYKFIFSASVSQPTDHGIVEVTGNESGTSRNQPYPLRVSSNGKYLESSDGVPFLWLADTWWHGLTRRLSVKQFRALADQRVEQGFSVIQLVAGLYPEMEPFAPEGESISGWAWNKNFSSLNTKWFDEADEKIAILIEKGLIPCIFACWGYYFSFMTLSQMVEHWRELIARWGAFPVVWCLAGEPALPLDVIRKAWAKEVTPDQRLTLDQKGSRDSRFFEEYDERIASAQKQQIDTLNQVATEVRKIEPFGRPITIHSSPGGQVWNQLNSEESVDFWLLQTGHGLNRVLSPSIREIQIACNREPSKPVINGEVCYEGFMGSHWQEVQRFFFWGNMLSGTAGHSYGAWGLVMSTTPECPGFYSGMAPVWHEARNFTGAEHVGIGRSILSNYPWHELKFHPEYVYPHQREEDYLLPFAAGTESGLRIIYVPSMALVRTSKMDIGCSIRLCELGEYSWRATIVNPRTGAAKAEFTVESEVDGSCWLRCGPKESPLPSREDWLIVLQVKT